MHVSIIDHGHHLSILVNIRFIRVKSQARNVPSKGIISNKLRPLGQFPFQLQNRKLFFHV